MDTKEPHPADARRMRHERLSSSEALVASSLPRRWIAMSNRKNPFGEALKCAEDVYRRFLMRDLIVPIAVNAVGSSNRRAGGKSLGTASTAQWTSRRERAAGCESDRDSGFLPSSTNADSRLSSGLGSMMDDSRPSRVGVVRGTKDLVRCPLLDEVAEVHHSDTVTQLVYGAEIVRDEKVGRPEFALNVREKVDEFGTRGGRKRGGRLVEHKKLRLRDDCARNCDPLLLTRAELETDIDQVRLAAG